MGSGLYYDPHTGRFLTRGINSQQTNPYVPWAADPSGMLFAPLALFSMVYGRRKKQAAKWEILLLVLLMGGSLALGLGVITVSANSGETTVVQALSIPVASYTSVQVGGTVSSSIPSVSGTPNNAPITFCIISLSPLPESNTSSTYVLIFYGLDVCNSETLVPYLDWARDKGYNVKTFRADTVNNTKDMTRKHVNEYIETTILKQHLDTITNFNYALLTSNKRNRNKSDVVYLPNPDRSEGLVHLRSGWSSLKHLFPLQ